MQGLRAAGRGDGQDHVLAHAARLVAHRLVGSQALLCGARAVSPTAAECDAPHHRYGFKWKLVNEMDLFFVVVYQGILQIAYLEAGGSVETPHC